MLSAIPEITAQLLARATLVVALLALGACAVSRPGRPADATGSADPPITRVEEKIDALASDVADISAKIDQLLDQSEDDPPALK